MRILWFTGVQLPAVTGQKLDRAGWQEGLRDALEKFHPEVQLSIASFGSEAYEPFTEGNTTYLNIYRQPAPGNRWKRLAQSWKHLSYNDDELDQCLELVEIVQPDLIFIFGTENPFGLLANRLPVPVIISIQAVINGLVERIFHGLSSRELLNEFFSKETIIGEGVFHRYWQLKKIAGMEKEIYSRCIVFSGRTEWDKNWLNRLNRKAIYYHIDRILGRDYYQHTWKYEDTSEDIIFTTSSNAPFKGGITLTRGFIQLIQRGKVDAKLHIAGVHPDSIVGKNILRLAKRHKITDRLKLIDRIPPQKIISEMKTARLFVLPSHMDNSPNSLGEAMLIGMPCIASNAGGIASMIQDGEDGLLYQHDDQDQLVEKIELLLGDPALAQKLGKNAKITAAARHDPATIADKTLEMYRQVVSGRVQARTQLPEKRLSTVEKISQRIKLAYHVTRYGRMPEPERIVNPYLSKRELDEIHSFFPMPKFFIYGHARSGTTLIARLIRVHPEVHCNYQAHFFTRPPTIHALVDSPIIREWLSRPDNRWNQGKDLSPVVLRITADYVMEREARQLGKTIVGDKSPNSLLDGKSVHKLYSVYPDARLIYIARDGRDTVLSHRFQAFIDFQESLSDEDRRIREDFIYHPEQFLDGRRSLFTRQGLILGAQSWVKNMVETETIGRERFGDHYYSFRYEDLIADTENEMVKIWEFLGVDAEFEDRSNLVKMESTKNPDADWQRHQERDLVSNLKKGSSGSWRELFTDQDKEVFNEIAGDVLEAWGYQD